MPTITLKARYGTWYRADNPGVVMFNKRSYLAMRGSGPDMKAFLYFSNPFNLPNAIVTSAKLRLYVRGGTTNTGTRTVTAKRPATGMAFRYLNYYSRPTTYRGAYGTSTTTGALGGSSVLEFDLTNDLQYIAKGSPFYGYELSTDAPFTMVVDGANSARPPELVITYSYPPTAPRDLSPAQGRAVSIPKPHVGFTYYDTQGLEKVSAVQVQTSAGSSFTSVAWDSGQVASSVPSLDLAQTTFPAMTSGQTRWWRVRAKSSVGIWSDWSQPTSFKYVPLPVVTITNPEASFSDPTPPITWTVDVPYVQWAASFRKIRSNGSQKIIEHSGRRTGSPDMWTPAEGAGQDGATYRIYVDVYDSVEREATPGAPIFGNAQLNTTFEPSSTVPAPTALTVESDYPRPEAVLSWRHTQLPDAWRIYRDDVLLATMPGVDTRLGATNRHEFRALAPAGEHTWRIRAVVNGKASYGSSATVATEFRGTWLFDEDGVAVCIQDDREHDMKYVEVSAIHEPLGSDRVVVVTQALRGLEGTLDGLLTGLKGQDETPELWRKNLLEFKQSPATQRTLVIEDQVIPVIIRNVTVKQAPKRARSWIASFEFYQQGGLPFDSSLGG